LNLLLNVLHNLQPDKSFAHVPLVCDTLKAVMNHFSAEPQLMLTAGPGMGGAPSPGMYGAPQGYGPMPGAGMPGYGYSM